MCDASDYAVRAILGQRVEKKPVVIYYASRTLDAAQQNYLTTKKELLEEFYLEIKDKKGIENDVPLSGMYLAKRLLTVRAGVQREFENILVLMFSVEQMQGCLPKGSKDRRSFRTEVGQRRFRALDTQTNIYSSA
ncbi:unnamed protein product [Rhodiola kirilowii]